MFFQASTALIGPCRPGLPALMFKLTAGLVLGLLPALVRPAAAAASTPASAASVEEYRDDRSSGEALVRSLYNAINRHEFLRAYSYFGEAAKPASFEDFAKGYQTTGHVRLKLGEAREEGAAGSLFTNVPVAIKASDRDGEEMVFSGCYVTRLAQPALQESPPFAPLHIEKATLAKVSRSFKTVRPTCPDR